MLCYSVRAFYTGTKSINLGPVYLLGTWSP